MATKRKQQKKAVRAKAKTKTAPRPKSKATPRAKSKAKSKAKKATRRPPASRGKRVPSRRGVGESDRVAPIRRLRASTGGQSGDLQGLSDREDTGPESVEELLEEGQAFEAEAVSGVENAPDADKSGVRTKEVPEDDVPAEYDDDTGNDSRG